MTIIEWTGLEVAALRTALRDTQIQFADRIGCSLEAVGKWERRGADITLGAKYSECMDTAHSRLDGEQRARFDAVLDPAGPPSNTSDIRSQSGRSFAITGVVPDDYVGAGPAIDLHDGGDPTNRRQALRVLGVSAVAGGIGIAGVVNNAARESTELMNTVERRPVDPDSLHDAAEDLYRLASDYAVDPDVSRIFVRLTALRDQIAASIRRTGPITELRDLYVLFSATCVLLASVSHDLAEPQAAMAQTRAASRFAELAGHRSLLSWVYCTRAMITSWWGRPEQVLCEIDRAGSKSGVAGLRMGGLEARAHAQCGNRESALAALHVARSQRERVTSKDELAELGPVFTFTSARQHYYDATTFARLGDWTSTQREAESVIRCYGPNPDSSWPVTLTLAQTDLARARLHLEGPQAALDTLLPAFEVPAVQRLPQFHAALGAIQSDLAAHPSAAGADGRTMHEAIRSFAIARTTTRGDHGRFA